MADQWTLGSNADGTFIITDATNGFTVKDAQGFSTVIKETATGLEMTTYDGANSVTYEIIGGKLKNIMDIVANVNGVLNQTITDEIIAANYYPKEGEIIESGGSSYQVISADSDVTNNEYKINLNNLGRLTIEGQISTDTADAPLTAELVKLGRYDWTEKEQIAYLDGSSKKVEVQWGRFDTENNKYIVKCSVLA